MREEPITGASLLGSIYQTKPIRRPCPLPQGPGVGRAVEPAGSACDARGARVNPARLLIVDDHALIREGLRAMLCGVGGIRVVAEAKDSQ